ncbi:MAG: FtsX-like permease family protein [Bacteroidales bacterium]|nr:FtsX-like permease family protein [Bacteroidales bacterium]
MKSYLKFLSRHKLYTAIEAVGLAVSLAFVILIGSYVVQQYHVAHENPDWNRIYAPGTEVMSALGYWDKEVIDMSIPEVEASTRLALASSSVFVFEGEKLAGPVGFSMEVDPEFFDLFPYFKWRDGSVDAFRQKDAVILSESMADRLLQLAQNGNRGEETDYAQLIGRVVNVQEQDYVVAGVIQDFRNSILPRVDALLNIASSYASSQMKGFNSIGNYSTLCRIRADVDRADFDARVRDHYITDYAPTWGEDKVKDWRTWRLDEIFWTGGDHGGGRIRQGNRQMANLLTVVVLLLLLSAVFNYINLSFALSGKRAKEMATRRLLGEDRSGVVWKSIGESVAFTAICFGVALLLVYLLAPMVNALLSTETGSPIADMGVALQVMLTPGYIATYVAGVLLLGTLCGLVPAWAASRYEAVDVIKGTLRRKSKMVFSKVFIVAQNTLAVFLIAMALLMEVQMKHMLDRPTHAAVDNRYYIEYSAMSLDQMQLFKDKVEKLPFVTKAGVGRSIPGSIVMSQDVKLEDGTHLSLPVILCDTTYFDLLGLEIVEDFRHPRLNSIWLDETAFKAAGVSDTSTVFPRLFGINGAKADYIGGVVRDFPVESASSSEMGTLNAGVIVTRPENLFYAHCLLIGTVGEDKAYERQILDAYEAYRMEQYGTYDAPWRKGFIRNLYRDQLAPARRTMRLLELFAVLSVLIALLGLLAMSAYYAGENTKQIAVRKVFGADVKGETWRNVMSYMVMSGIACLVAIPLAVWAARLYLQRFPYRIENYGWVFAAAVVIGVVIAFATVLWQTVKAAQADPAVELKKD